MNIWESICDNWMRKLFFLKLKIEKVSHWDLRFFTPDDLNVIRISFFFKLNIEWKSGKSGKSEKMSTISDGPFDNHVLYQSLCLLGGGSGASITEQSKLKKRLLNTSDSILSLIVISPLVICHWRGTWDGMDQYERIFPAMNCMLLGSILHCAFAILREPLHRKFNIFKARESKTLIFKLQFHTIRILYTYFFSLSCIMQW